MTTNSQVEQFWQPHTFLERGVAVPFTTPVLAGARARLRGHKPELVVPHPAQVRGVYIVSLSDLPNFCVSTLHDLMMCDALAGLRLVTPHAVRIAARTVAARGAAGRAAQAAAVAAETAEKQEGLATMALLLQKLVQQATGSIPSMQDLERAAKAAIIGLAGKQGRRSDLITTDLEALVSLFACVGLGEAGKTSRCGQLIIRMRQVCRELKLYIAGHPGSAAKRAGIVVAAAEATQALHKQVVAEQQSRVANLALLLAECAADMPRVAAALARPDWLLDGWDRVCLVWQLAEASRPRAAISEMALMTPVLPPEADSWGDGTVATLDLLRVGNQVNSFADWRTGSMVVDLVARNERMRALGV